MRRHLQFYSWLCLTRMMKWQSLFALGKLLQMVPLFINSTLCFIKFWYVAVIWVSLSCYNNLRCGVRCQNPKPSFNFGAPYGANTSSDLWEIQTPIEYFNLGQTYGLHRGGKEPRGLGRRALVLGQDGVWGLGPRGIRLPDRHPALQTSYSHQVYLTGEAFLDYRGHYILSIGTFT